MKIWLDDLRKEPQGWHRTYWPDEVIELIKTGSVREVSLDHDLGNDDRGTGLDVLLWLEEEVYVHELRVIPKINIHTANPVAREKMIKTIDSIQSEILRRNIQESI